MENENVNKFKIKYEKEKKKYKFATCFSKRQKYNKLFFIIMKRRNVYCVICIHTYKYI